MLVQILLSLLSKKCPTEDRVLFVLMKMKQRNGISCCCIDCHFVLLYRLSDMFIIVVSQVQILMECSYNLGQFCLKDEIVWCILVKYVNFRKRVGHYAISSQYNTLFVFKLFLYIHQSCILTQTTFGSTFVPYLYLHQQHPPQLQVLMPRGLILAPEALLLRQTSNRKPSLLPPAKRPQCLEDGVKVAHGGVGNKVQPTPQRIAIFVLFLAYYYLLQCFCTCAQ